MTYELAEELKDAGFLQILKKGGYFFDSRGTLHQEDEDYLAFPGDIVVPTLTELIDACGDDILGISRTHADDGTPNGWVADTHTHECDCGKPKCFGFNWEHEVGKTPEEAVARLWLAINKKK